MIGADSSDTQPAADEGSPVDGRQLILRADHKRYDFGENIRLDVDLKNVGADAIDVARASYFPYTLAVVTPAGKDAQRTEWGKQQDEYGLAGSATVVRLRPGETTTETFPILNRAFDMSINGEYRVTVSAWPGAGGTTKRTNLVSNTIIVRVGPPGS